MGHNVFGPPNIRMIKCLLLSRFAWNVSVLTTERACLSVSDDATYSISMRTWLLRCIILIGRAWPTPPPLLPPRRTVLRCPAQQAHIGSCDSECGDTLYSNRLIVPICLYCLNCTKFGQLVLRKITKIVATRCHILRLKCTKLDFGC